MQKITYLTESCSTNHETGEIQSSESCTTIQIPQEPPFVKLYLDDIVRLNDLPKSSSKVLRGMIKYMSYNSDIVINAGLKRIIAKEIGIKEQSISNAITGFIKKDIMTRVETGIYMLNPELFAKGSWTDVRKLRNKYVELRITYKDGKREMHSVISDIKNSDSSMEIEK
jgi:hypothetical protein